MLDALIWIVGALIVLVAVATVAFRAGRNYGYDCGYFSGITECLDALRKAAEKDKE